MKAYIFFSVHEELFHRMATILRDRGVDDWSGFVWGQQQKRALSDRGIQYDPLLVFSTDLLPHCDDGKLADLAWLARRETALGISLQRMLAAERHLLAGRTHEQIMRMAEVALREIAAVLDRVRPDFIFSEDISCFHSYVHFALAKERGIPFWCISTGRLPNRISVYSSGMQHWERFLSSYEEISGRRLTTPEREAAEAYLHNFRNRPARPTGMTTRAQKPRIELADAARFRDAARRSLGDPNDPTVIPPLRIIQQRLVRMARVAAADVLDMFEPSVAGEHYVLYPLHFQPEASTLVQGPLYVDQLALLRDMAVSLPIGHRLYVKEHVSSRGRRPMGFYEAIKAIPAVRLLGPDEDTWTLIRDAAAVAVITGTVGWEGLMFEKPVVTFGDVFFNVHPSVYRAGRTPKDDWYELFRRAIHHHVHDREAVLVMIAAMHQASYPGFMGNPSSFPEALVPENVMRLVNALCSEMGLPHENRAEAAP